MSWNYNFIDHTADIAVDVTGDTIEDLFTASAFAWKEGTIEGNDVNSFLNGMINIKGYSYEELLVNFLNELNFLLISKKQVFAKIEKLKIKRKSNQIILNAGITFGIYNEKKHTMKAEIKAVTFHQMEIKRSAGKFYTRIVFDI